ncbi:unnamed protein product [Brachionus calyciflorus]|uniref:Uncharacterized protein n=1 Tax=Brachionus calyciflorus TaxID=104777 RepID=A0A814C1X5_9BILA|nr:unnamed protein product [Brachionus calyciflorus]
MINFQNLFEVGEWLLFFPSNSTDCERPISVYNKILNRFSKDSFISLNFITSNNQKTSPLSNEPVNNDVIADDDNMTTFFILYCFSIN